MPSQPIYLNHVALINALGSSLQQVFERLVKGNAKYMTPYMSRYFDKQFIVGSVKEPLPVLSEEYSHYDCRNNRLLIAAAQQIQDKIQEYKNQYSAQRIGIVLGTSTSGIEEFELNLAAALNGTAKTNNFHYKQSEIGSIAEFLSRYLDLNGPAYTISTACSSSGKVFASARALIEQDICDMVITGGVDSLCEMTLNGFDSLDAISEELTNPFSINRKGINIGEGAALFIMSKTPSDICLLGVGESSDAHHISAPHPEGHGAVQAMQAALNDANLAPEQVDYLNLHGTGTPLNDAMESHAVKKVFSHNIVCSSTKPLIGHTLGAAGANEAAFAWLLLSDFNSSNLVPPHIFDGQFDPKLSPINLAHSEQQSEQLDAIMSNSFAFGGNNVSLILGKTGKLQNG